MKKQIAFLAAVLMMACPAVCSAKDFSVSFDEPYCFLETDEISMFANSIEVDNLDYLVIDTLVQNNNSDGTTYEVSIPRAAVNGVEIYPTYSEDVEDECDETIDIDLSNVFEFAELTEITDIELEVKIEDDDSDTVYHDTVHIYPYGEEKAVKYERAAADTDIVLIDNDDFTVSAIGCEYVEDWGYSVHLYIQNKMQEPICLEGEYFELNEVDADTWYDDVVGAGDVCFSHVEWSQGDLDDAEITEVNSVQFILSVYDYSMDNLLYEKTVDLKP